MKDARINPKQKRTLEEWVRAEVPSFQKPEKPAGETKRVTIDLPLDIHQKLKIKCVVERVNIADMVRGWIEEKLRE